MTTDSSSPKPADRSLPLVYGYIRTLVDDPTHVADCKDQLAGWCAREGWRLGAVFVDCGGPLDDERIGFRGLLDALSLPQASAAVLLNATHLSPLHELACRLVDTIRKTGCVVRVRDGELPTMSATGKRPRKAR